MVMRYPTATARSKARPGSLGSPKTFPQRPINITPRKVPGVTFPKPPIPARVGLKLATRAATRFVPVIGTALLLYDAYEIYRSLNGQPNPMFWVPLQSCGGVSYWYQGFSFDWRPLGCGTNFTLAPPWPHPAYQPGIPNWTPGAGNYLSGFEDMGPSGGNRILKGTQLWQRQISPEGTPSVLYSPTYGFPGIWGNPWATPEGYPLSPLYGTPVPKPWAEALPGVGEQPSAAPELAPAPQSKPIWEIPVSPFPIIIVPGVFPGMPPDVLPPPSPPVQEVVIPSPSTGQNPRVDVRPRTNSEAKNKPPRNREKEKKIHVRTVAGAGWAVINLFTEGLDFLDVVWEALPKKDRTKGRPKPYDKAKDIYEHWDQIDIAKAIENYINNQIEDYVYGMIGKKVAKAQGVIGSPTGLSRSLSKTRGQFVEELGGELELPEVHYDPTTGEIYLTGFGFSSR